MTVRVQFSKEIEVAEVIRELTGHHTREQGSPHEVLVDCRDREEADLVLVNMNSQPGVRAKIEGTVS